MHSAPAILLLVPLKVTMEEQLNRKSVGSDGQVIKLSK